ncbi:histidine phosphatase family protein [Millisia brevis]|uniref:histidine phosphatase family protein n=1 Tax=Millisia brevis TaxID=264148 RepID=UPI00082C3303|nr:histidine phosphatase family protein [Millisia brevis]
MTAPAQLWLVRHGETEWSRDGRHTSTTNLDLTDIGVEAAVNLHDRLSDHAFDRVLCSPLLRARRTAELAGFTHPTIEPDLTEWRYGDYEGLTREQIRATRPDWLMWRDGCPNGESPDQIADRVDHLIFRLRALGGRTLLFAHGHILRSLAVRWIDQPLTLGSHLPLGTTAVSQLGSSRGVSTIDRWNA